MPSTRFALVVLTSGLLAAGCGGNPNSPSDDDAPPTVAQIVGTWTATSVRVAPQLDQSQFTDLVQQGGSATLTISANDRFTFVENYPTRPTNTRTRTGSLRFEGGFLVMVADDTPNDPISWLKSGSDDRMELEGDDTFDFDNDGIREPARFSYDFDRR